MDSASATATASPAAPQTAASLFLREFSVTVSKREGVRYGLRVRAIWANGSCLFITEIKPDGAIAEWNRTNPSQKVQVSDAIAAVNGISGNAQAMANELKHNSSMEITIRRMDSMEQAGITFAPFGFKKLPAAKALVDRLPCILAGEYGIDECVVCHDSLELDALVTVLPCAHAFCTPCITKWLLQYKNECPLCVQRVDALAPTGVQSDSGPIYGVTRRYVFSQP